MNVKEMLKQGIDILKKEDVAEGVLQAKIFLAYILECKKEELIIKEKEEVRKELENKFFKRNRENIKRLPSAIFNKSKRIYGNELLCR